MTASRRDLDHGGHTGKPHFADPALAERWRVARRAALDHLLALTSASWSSDNLVLRGSMLLHAWAPDRAREPADIDWVVVGPEVAPGTATVESPYGDLVDLVDLWPEVEAGEPAGLAWEVVDTPAAAEHPYGDLIDLLRTWPQAAHGVVLDPDGARTDGDWTYETYDSPGVRLIVPWRAEGLPPGEVQMDFARDEWLPEPPVFIRVLRGDGGKPTVVRAATRELSLAWKILWLQRDCQDGGRARGKDLYDAVLLAELAQTNLSLRLLRKVLYREMGHHAAESFGPDSVYAWHVDWESFRADHPSMQGTARDWLDRLARALEPMLTAAGRPSPRRRRRG